MLTDQRLLITGIATPDSIAYATARAALDHGARLACTAFPRDLDAARDLMGALDPRIEVHALDLCDRERTRAVGALIGETLGGLDGALHAVAFAPRTALGGDFVDADPEDVELAFRTSAWTFAGLTGLVRDLASPRGASVVGLDFDANGGAWPVYNWMGVCKAALRSAATYLARDLGREGIRVNLVAAGPLATRAAGGIPGFDQLLDVWERTAPIAWSPTDPSPVADTVCFLLSHYARAITGEVVHVDGGYHAMAGPLPASA